MGAKRGRVLQRKSTSAKPNVKIDEKLFIDGFLKLKLF